MNGFDYLALGASPVRSPKQRLHRLTPKKIAGFMFVLASLWGALKGAALVLRATHNASSHHRGALTASLSTSFPSSSDSSFSSLLSSSSLPTASSSKSSVVSSSLSSSSASSFSSSFTSFVSSLSSVKSLASSFSSTSSLLSYLPATLSPPLSRVPLLSTEQPESPRPERSFSSIAPQAAVTDPPAAAFPQGPAQSVLNNPAATVLALPLSGYTPLSHYMTRQTNWVKLRASASSLRDADQRAQQVPRQVLQSGHAATAAWLAEGLESDTAKTRAVFSFIAQHVTYDHERALDIDSGRYMIQLPRGQTRSQTLSREAFQTKKAVCEGISHLLNEMLASIDIRSRYVSGICKGRGYVVGDAIPDSNGHGWNLVYLEGGWHLMDVTWSLWKNNSSDSTTPGGPERTDYAYWDADPRVLMFSHFPSTPADSLMEQALTRNEFISSVEPGYPSSTFALLRGNQQGQIPANGTLMCEGSPLVLRLLVPDDYVVSSSLYSEAEMRREQSSFSDVVKKKERFAVSAMRAADQTPASGRSSTSGSVVYVPFDLVISPRRPGIFFCVVLGGRPGSLRNVLWYKIDARKVPLQGLPAVASVEEPLSFHTLGVLSTQSSAHGGGVIVPGSLQIDTEGSATILLPGAERSRMMAEVKVDGKLVEHFAFVRTQENRFNVQVRSPVIGNAVKAELHLYTKSIDAADDVSYYLALSYEIEATAVRSVPPRFPEIKDTFFRDLCFPPGVQSSSYLNGVIRTDLSGYALLVLGGADKSKILTELIDLGSKSEIEDFTMVEKQGALFRIHVRAPRPHSKLELRIFSKPSGDPAMMTLSFSIAYEVDASHVAQPRGRFAQVTQYFFERLTPSAPSLSSMEGVLKINSMGLGTLTVGGGRVAELLLNIVNGKEEKIEQRAVSERRGDVHHIFVRLGASQATEANPLSLQIFSRKLGDSGSYAFTAAYRIDFSSTNHLPPPFPDFTLPLTAGSVLDKVVTVAPNHHVRFAFAAPANCVVANIEVVLTSLSGRKSTIDLRTRVSRERHPLSLAGDSARHEEILIVDIGPIPPSMSGARLLAAIQRITRREGTQYWFMTVAEYELQVLKVGATAVAPTTTTSLLPLQETDMRTKSASEA
eukprot:g12562.t1